MDLLERINKLIEVGIALSSESDLPRLLEMILIGAKKITNADGGTLYSVQEDQTIKMEILRTDSLDFAMGGTTGKDIPFPPIPMYDEQGHPNNHMVVTYAVLNDQTINIPDAYDAEGFDFSGTQKFDANTGYRSTSFLTIPMKNHEEKIIGVLQLLNAQDDDGSIIAFSPEAQRLAEALASQAAIALTNRQLIGDLQELFESFIQMIATAIDEKSPYTGGHGRRVPVITMMLAEAASGSGAAPFKDFHLSDEDLYELKIAAWLHDCGKITTPEYVVDKSTKLETIHDRIADVETRYELLKRDAEIAFLRTQVEAANSGESLDLAAMEQHLQNELTTLNEELEFLRTCNVGGEFMSPEHQQRVRDIGQRRIFVHGEEQSLLSENEIYNLNIEKGTLTDEERTVINNHIVATIKMLESLPFPEHLKRVPEFAGGHHEKMDGTGYPRQLTREQMSVQARMMAIADIFEALTAGDRPYKPAKKLSEALRILGFMNKDNHIDPDLFKLFIDEKIYLRYANEFLRPEQIDEVDISKIPGYTD